MFDALWPHIIQRIPEAHQHALAVVTTTGTELVVQQIFKLEREFMVVRARTAGTMDTGRVIIVAYSQIDYLAFNNKLGEAEVADMFNEPFPEVTPAATSKSSSRPTLAPPTPKPATAISTAASSAMIAASTASTPLPATTDSGDGAAAKPGQISKSVLLARLRERLAEKSK
jgi:hypothetical protein